MIALARLLGLDFVRGRLLRKAPAGPLRDYLSVPFPRPGNDWRAASYAALDLETTGLDPGRDEIVSVGWVCLEGSRIDLSTARHRLVRPSRPLTEQSAVIHRITDDAATAGDPLRVVLAEVLAALAGKVLIAHNATFELRFLGKACRSALGGRILIPAVDTLDLAWRSFERRNLAVERSELRLDALRRRHNLPRYRAHNALSDALAAAELFLALVAQREGTRAVSLRSVLLAQ